MLTTIVGGLWILGGLFFLYKPDWLKGRLQKKGVKGVRRLVFALSLASKPSDFHRRQGSESRIPYCGFS